MIGSLIFEIIILILMSVVYTFFNNAIEPLLKNSIYINQMNNSELNYTLIHSYPCIKMICIIILAILFISIVIDLITIYKKKNKEKKYED